MREVHKQRIGGWSVLMEWPDGAESGGPVRLVIEAADPSSPPIGGLSSTVLREVDFQEATAKLAAFFQMARDQNRQSDEAMGHRLRSELAGGVTPEYLVQLCADYVRLVERGRDRPTEYLAELIGKSTSTIKGHLWQAKNKGLFVGSAGRVGGELTAEGQRILDDVVMEALKEADKRRSSET
ncbi:hypothetical protein [Mycobacterium marinum]|uniref:hypothetical protein n=1 Tax=Mycobacterium marinum TaxID=1781 RepID=UPI00235A41F9|nr:hypothetical protein [Mycobacterium marinum]MDC8980549.1 hypothetical protein [Mycobacterium marinum]